MQQIPQVLSIQINIRQNHFILIRSGPKVHYNIALPSVWRLVVGLVVQHINFLINYFLATHKGIAAHIG